MNPVWIIVFAGGLAIVTWIFFWSRQRQQIGHIQDITDQALPQMQMSSGGDAILVSTEHGQLIYANEAVRRWFGLDSGVPSLEYVAQLAQPSDSFLDLLSSEGQASFQLGKRWVEASSHYVPTETGRQIVVRMRELTAGNLYPGALDLNKSIEVINEIGQTVNASMGMEQILQLLLTIIMKAVPATAGEICLWDEKEEALYQRGWVGDTTYLLALSELGGLYRMDEGVPGWVAHFRKPAMINDFNAPTALQPKVMDSPFNSELSLPLMLEDRLLGTVELFHEDADHFTQGDLALLQAVSTPMAVAIYNAMLYSEQVQRVSDMASLQQVSGERSAEDTYPVYRALNERIARLISADMCGVFLYDDKRVGLLAEPPFFGLPDHVSREIFLPLPQNSPQRDIWENQPYWISNDVVDEPLAEAMGLRPLIDVAGIYNTAMIPLQIGGERRGILVISNKRTEGGFTPRDIQNMLVLAAQASIVVENIRLFQRGKRLDTELVGLQEITHAIGALSHEGEFYSEITERIAKLMGIAMCGILLYDEEGRCLKSQLPFYGVEDDLIREYRINLAPGSVMYDLWNEEDYWFTNNARADALVFEAGLDEIAEKIGIKQTLIAALSAGGRRLGVVQVSNKLDGEDFTANDARLLLIFSTQAGAIIENARLFREAQRSAEQAQSLRRVAEIAGSVLTTEETFTPVLAEIANLTGSELVFINVMSQQTGSLITYPRWVYGVELNEPIVQDIHSAGFEYSVPVTQRPFFSNDLDTDKRVLPGYKQIADKFGITRAVIVPLLAGERCLGELGIANRPGGPYVEDDLELLSTVAAQVTTALDRLLLYEATGKNLTRRMEELDAISIVSNELTLTLDLNQVLDVVRQEAARTTKATGSTIALLRAYDQGTRPDRPELSHRIGEAARLPRLIDIELEAISRGADTVLITDFANTAMDVPNWMRSAVAASILYVDQVVGVITLFHEEPNHFDHQSAAFLMTLSTKAALGYGNAARYQELMERSSGLRRRVEQLNQIFELGQLLQSSTDPETILEAIAYSVQQSAGFDTVLMLAADEELGMLRRVAHAGMPIDQFNATRNRMFPLDRLNKLLDDEYRISESYFFPMEKFKEWHVDGVSALSARFEGNRTMPPRGKDFWHDGDLLLVRFSAPSGNLLGVMSLDRPQNDRRPDRSVIEVLEIFAHQATITLENTRLYLSSMRSAEQEARLNEIMEAVSRTLDIDEIIAAMANGALRLVPFMRMTVALQNTAQEGFDLLQVNVQEDSTLAITRDHRPDLDNSALGRTFTEGIDYLYHADDKEIEQYEDLLKLHEQGEQTSLVVPLVTGGRTLGAIHLGSDLINAYGFAEFRALLKRMAQLVASAIQNTWLFDRAVNLQVLNESVVMSIQQGIVVLDQVGHIISFNDFMRQRYHWEDTAVRQEFVVYRPVWGKLLAGNIGNILQTGEPNELLHQVIVDQDGQNRVSNFYLYPLRAENTIRGAVLLVEDSTERSRLEQAIEVRANQLAALTDASNRITASLERSEVIEQALAEMRGILPYDVMTIWRRNGPYMVLNGASGEVGDDLKANETRIAFHDYEHTEKIVETQRVVYVHDVDSLPRKLPGDEGAKSWMGIPIVSQGHVVGIITLVNYEPGHYDTLSEQNIAFTFASQVAIALANADLFEQTFDRTNELGTLLEAAQATSQTRDLDEVFRTVVELMFSALDMDDCTIMLWDEVDNELVVQVDMNRHGDTNRVAPVGTRYTLADYKAKLQALNRREVLVITVDNEEAPFAREVEELRERGDVARMLVPLVVGDQSIGLIQLEQASGERVVTQQKVRLARALGSQVAIAIDNARLSGEMTAQFEELILINDLSQAISGTLELEEVLRIVRDRVPPLTRSHELYVALYNAQTEEITFPLVVKDGKEGSLSPRKLGDDEVSFVIRHRQPLSLGADYYDLDEMRRNLGIVNGEGDIQSYMGVPLIVGDQVLGVLAVRDAERKRAFTVNESRILTTVGSQLGATIQNAKLYEQVRNFADDLNTLVEERTNELEVERDNLDTLYQITSELARTLDMERLLGRALGMVAKAVNADDGAIMRIDSLTDTLYSQAVINPALLQPGEDGERPKHPAEDLATWLIEHETVIVIDDLHKAEFWDKDAPGAAEWRSALAVVLETNEDIQGVMVLLSRRPMAFSEDQLRLLVAAANQVASAINNADLYQLIRDQAERLGTLLRAEQEEAEKSHAILEGIADAVILADAQGTVILFNSAAERILQLPREQVLGQQLSKLTGLYGGAATAWVQAIQDWASRDWSVTQSDEGQFLDERLELGERVVSVHLSPVHIGVNFLGTVSVFRDITRDVEVDRMKSEFVSSVSHELRTPLTPIKGYTDLLMAGAIGELSGQQTDALGKIRENVERLTLLVEDVLDISKIDSGHERLRIKILDLGDLINELMPVLHQRHRHKVLTVMTVIDDDVPVIAADPDKLVEVIRNIVDNAFNYTPAGGSIDIRVRLQPDKRHVLISVADTGLGIPENYRDAVWRRFERYEEHALAMDVAGTGLGLPIVKELVNMHHGEVWFESEVGKGTTFFVLLPVQQPERRTGTGELMQVKTEPTEE